MKRKKVLLIGPYPPPSGGVSVHLRRLLEKSGDLKNLKLAVLDLRKRTIFYADGNAGGLFQAVLYFFSATIIHVHISHPFKMGIARIAKLVGKKVFYTIHNPRSADDPLTRKMIRLSDRVIFVYTPEKLPLNGIVLPAYIPQTRVQLYAGELPEETINYKNWLVSVSSFSGELNTGSDLYGFELILEAFEKIRPTIPVALILVDTNGKLIPSIAKQIELINKQTSRKVFYIGKEISFQNLVAGATVFIRATTSDGDALSVREALQAGTPVLASDCVSRPEGCHLFRNGDAGDLAAKLENLMKENRRTVYHQQDYSLRLFEMYTS